MACTYIDDPTAPDAGPCTPVEVMAACEDGWAVADWDGYTAAELSAVVALGVLGPDSQSGYTWLVMPGVLLRDGGVAVACGPVFLEPDGPRPVEVVFRVGCW